MDTHTLPPNFHPYFIGLFVLFCKDLPHARNSISSFILLPSCLSMKRWKYVCIVLQEELNLPKAII